MKPPKKDTAHMSGIKIQLISFVIICKIIIQTYLFQEQPFES